MKKYKSKKSTSARGSAKSRLSIQKQRIGLKEKIRSIRPLSENEKARLERTLKAIEAANSYEKGLNRIEGGFSKTTILESDKETIDISLKSGIKKADLESDIVEETFQIDRSTMKRIYKEGGPIPTAEKYQINIHGEKPTDYKIICKIVRSEGKDVQVCYHETNDKKVKGVEVYSGANYIVGSKDRSFSKRYDLEEVPVKYKATVSELKEAHHDRFEESGSMAEGGTIKVEKKNDGKYYWTLKDSEGKYIKDSVVGFNTSADAQRDFLRTKTYSSGGSMAKGGEVNKITYPTERLEVKEQSIEERELQLFIENDANLYRQRTVPIQTNLVTKIARGEFDINKAPQIFKYLIDDGIKKYNKEYGGGMSLTKEEKDNLSRTFTNEFLEEAQYGNYENYLPKKYQTKEDGGSMAEGGTISPEKARKILHDGEVHGKPLTEEQRKFFGARSSGYPVKRKEEGGYSLGGRLSKEEFENALQKERVGNFYIIKNTNGNDGAFENYYDGGMPFYVTIYDVVVYKAENRKDAIMWIEEKIFGKSMTYSSGGSMATGGKVSSSDLLDTIKKRGNKITEQEINLIKLRENNDKKDEGQKELIQYIWDNTPELTEEQNKKGFEFLMNKWKSPSGKERSNNPYGYREQEVLEKFKYFELAGFYDISRYGGRKFYVPLYNAIGEDGSFQYYVNMGEINIVG